MLVVLVRLVDGQVERLRTFGDDCPLDAGGLPVLWLDGPTTADSLTFLGALIGEPGPSVPAARQRVGEAALSGVALHQGADADAILDRFATAASDSNLRRLARTSDDLSVKKAAVGALGRSTNPRAVQYLEDLIRK